MTDSLKSNRESAQFYGPTTSDHYNERVDNVYLDLVYLYNKIGLADEESQRKFRRLIKDHFALAKTVEELEARLNALTNAVTTLDFYSRKFDDTARFDSTNFEVMPVSRCSYDLQHGLLTLPNVESASTSKVGFYDSLNNFIVPPSFEEIVIGSAGSADSTGAIIDTSDVYNSVLVDPGSIWERNVIVGSTHINGAILYLYVKLPTDTSTNINTNGLIIHPYPITGCDILSVAATRSTNVNLNDSDVYTPLNAYAYHENNTDAIGWIAPGGWSGDEMLDAGAKAFYFDPEPITALRIKLRQRNYFVEGGKYIYSYGLSKLDVRANKYTDTGKIILRFDAPNNGAISSIDNVIPHIWNVPEFATADVFDYRVIWETSYNSGNYTLEPMPMSKRVWIEVSLFKTLGGGTPALSGLKVEYT